MKEPRVAENNEAGATVVEFSIVVGLCLFIVFMGIDVLFLGYRALSLQHTANTVLRQTVVGPPAGSLPNYDHAQAMVQLAKKQAKNLGLKISPNQIQICPQSQVNCQANSSGKGNEFVVVRIDDYPRLFLSLIHI